MWLNLLLLTVALCSLIHYPNMCGQQSPNNKAHKNVPVGWILVLRSFHLLLLSFSDVIFMVIMYSFVRMLVRTCISLLWFWYFWCEALLFLNHLIICVCGWPPNKEGLHVCRTDIIPLTLLTLCTNWGFYVFQ